MSLPSPIDPEHDKDILLTPELTTEVLILDEPETAVQDVPPLHADIPLASDFRSFHLPVKLLDQLESMGYKTPTPIQSQAIPLAVQGRDILGTAQTGTGKTGSFAIPIIARIMSSPKGSALVLLPTRELATQVMEVINQMLGKRSFIPTALLIGGESMPAQTVKLRMRPRIIVGTPGRINDHLERGNMMLHDTSILVLDETDRMLDMGFGPQIDRIIKYLPQSRQTLMFSATLPAEILKLSAKYLRLPERIAVGAVNKPVLKIQQDVLFVHGKQKFDDMLAQLRKREGSIIVFVNTRRDADRIAELLNRRGHKADTIHGDLQQRQREKVIQLFRDKAFPILVATDIAARGLDIPHIEHVINYSLPMNPEDYIHRIGRTGRNGQAGHSICLVASEDRPRWAAIQRLLHPEAKSPEERFPPELPGDANQSSRGDRTRRNRSRTGKGSNTQPQSAAKQADVNSENASPAAKRRRRRRRSGSTATPAASA